MANKFKFRILSPEHSAAIQNRLFELGFRWRSTGKETSFIHRRFLYAGVDGGFYLTYGETESLFNDSIGKEITLDQLYDPKILKLQPNIEIAGNIVLFQEDSVKVGCTTVHKDTIAEIYKHFNP